MSPPGCPLDPKLLYLFVIGPGTGETVLLRVPPNQWVVVDSFINAKRPAAEKVILEYGGDVAAVILTHPHRDHYGGFLTLIDNYPDAVIGCIHPREEVSQLIDENDPIHVVKRQSQATYTRIWDVWRDTPARKWRTLRNRRLPVGDGCLLSLHPVAPSREIDWEQVAVNDLSSAMQFKWHHVTLLLGADASNTAWDSIAVEFDGVADHQAMKVPHHGSAESIHSSFGAGDDSRTWIVTPFASKKLPFSGAAEGLAKCLRYVSTVSLTSLPYSHDRENESPCRISRSSIEKNRTAMSSRPVTVDPLLRAERYVAIAFDAEGDVRGRWYGAGTLEVGEDEADSIG